MRILESKNITVTRVQLMTMNHSFIDCSTGLSRRRQWSDLFVCGCCVLLQPLYLKVATKMFV